MKKSRSEKKFNFYNATVMASILKDVILEDKTKMSCIERFQIKSEKVKAQLNKAMCKTSVSMKRLMSKGKPSSFSNSMRIDSLGDFDDIDWDPEGRTMLSRYAVLYIIRLNLSTECLYILRSKNMSNFQLQSIYNINN